MSDQILDLIRSSTCPTCGCSGLHACTGAPMIPWTDEETERMKAALKMVIERETGNSFEFKKHNH